MNITPAGMTYERAFAIATAVVAAEPRRVSPVDADIARLHAAGLSDRAIADAIGTSRQTVLARRGPLGLNANFGFTPPGAIAATTPTRERTA